MTRRYTTTVWSIMASEKTGTAKAAVRATNFLTDGYLLRAALLRRWYGKHFNGLLYQTCMNYDRQAQLDLTSVLFVGARCNLLKHPFLGHEPCDEADGLSEHRAASVSSICRGGERGQVPFSGPGVADGIFQSKLRHRLRHPGLRTVRPASLIEKRKGSWHYSPDTHFPAKKNKTLQPRERYFHLTSRFIEPFPRPNAVASTRAVHKLNEHF